MGKIDQLSRKYIRRRDVFADIVNVLEYGGDRVVIPEMLAEDAEDTSELLNVPGKNKLRSQQKKEQYVERFRDVLRTVYQDVDKSKKYAVFGIEEYTEIHYGAPVKLMLYDALDYGNQIEAIASQHRANHDKPADSGEFLSGIYREDKLIPVRTLIVYFNAKPWDGPKSLHDMLDFDGWTEEDQNRIPNYPLSILEPARITEEQLDTMDSELKFVLGFIKYSTDRKKLDDYIHQHKEFSAMSNESVRLLDEVCSLHLEYIQEYKEDKKGEVDMCKAIEDMKLDAREEGRIEHLVSLICRKLAKGKDVETIADELEENLEYVEEICEIAEKYAPEYNVDEILQSMKKAFV